MTNAYGVPPEDLGGQPSSKFVAQAFTGAKLVRGFNHLVAAELKLPKLPDRTPVKLSITITPELSTALAAYAAAYREAYGQDEPIAELIPAMLSTFLDSDKSFSRSRKERS